MKPQVLVVDDDRLFCESLIDHFEARGLCAAFATSLHGATALPLERFSVVVVDHHLPDGSGLALVDAAARTGAGPSFIMVTGDPSYEHAVVAMRSRVLDYMGKPVALEALTGAVLRACTLSTHAPAPAAAVELPEDVACFARSDVPILITGETGTGKTRLAHRIHLASPRAQQPFVSINCATLAESLVEAELFGACRGAFTGATERPGLMALAEGGTLLLDEIGELPPSMQAKLLSVLEERRVRRIGATRWESLDVRIVTATHVELSHAVVEGRFRADLLYRLDVGRVRLPALRERPQALGSAVAQLLAELDAPSSAQLEHGELRRLAAHRWPGNYRELRNALARALILHPPQALRPSACVGSGELASVLESAVPASNEALTLAALERRHVMTTLAAHDGHRGHSARALGISEATLRRKLRGWSDPTL